MKIQVSSYTMAMSDAGRRNNHSANTVDWSLLTTKMYRLCMSEQLAESMDEAIPVWLLNITAVKLAATKRL